MKAKTNIDDDENPLVEFFLTLRSVESVAAQARDMAMESAALVYQDTCMQAVETCKAVEDAQSGRGKRTLQ